MQCLVEVALGSEFVHLNSGSTPYMQVLGMEETDLTEPYFPHL